MARKPITVDEAMAIAKNKKLQPAKVKGTEGIQFTIDGTKRLTIIDWDEFKVLLKERKLQIYESGGWMKIMKK